MIKHDNVGNRRQMTRGHLVEAKASTYVGQGFSLDQPERLPAFNKAQLKSCDYQFGLLPKLLFDSILKTVVLVKDYRWRKGAFQFRHLCPIQFI